MTKDLRDELGANICALIGKTMMGDPSTEVLSEVSFVLAMIMPTLVDRRCAHSQIEAVYDSHAQRHPELDRALPMDTGPMERVDLDG